VKIDIYLPVSQYLLLGEDPYKIRVTSTGNSSYVDASWVNFSIAPASITVIAPNGSEKWGAGSRQVINWTYKGNPGSSVKIELLRGGALDGIVASEATGSGGSGS